jgi:hypothetical protein
MCFLIHLFPKGLNEDSTATSFAVLLDIYACLCIWLFTFKWVSFHMPSLNKYEQTDIGTGVCRQLSLIRSTVVL